MKPLYSNLDQFHVFPHCDINARFTAFSATYTSQYGQPFSKDTFRVWIGFLSSKQPWVRFHISTSQKSNGSFQRLACDRYSITDDSQISFFFVKMQLCARIIWRILPVATFKIFLTSKNSASSFQCKNLTNYIFTTLVF